MEIKFLELWPVYAGAALAGYLIGSVTFPKLLNRLLINISKRKGQVSGEEVAERSDPPPIYSATFVGTQHGRKYGCVTSILDMIKVIIPMLIVKYYYPEQAVHLVLGLAVITGNNFPVFKRFKGGAGYSVILGSVLAINWFGVFIANGAAMVLGYFLGNVMVMRIAGNILYIVWFWIYFNDIYHVGFILLANLVFWVSVTRLLRLIPQVKGEEGETVNQDYWSKKLLMGGKFGAFIDEYGFPALMRKLFRK
jgi:glycerol-3-phosphate acyltransferase PlsY